MHATHLLVLQERCYHKLVFSILEELYAVCCCIYSVVTLAHYLSIRSGSALGHGKL